MLTASAYAATSPTEPLAPTTVERRDLGPRDVLIDIKYCGICHTDIHWVRGDWGEKDYPVVPGHEIAGVVAEVGPEVTTYAVGDRVGVGCMVNSCGECGPCRQGEEQYCTNGTILTYGSIDRDGTLTQGGYATHVVVDQDFVLRIPEGIGLDEAAPLLCAGVTTYSPLKRWGAGPGKKVGVIGLGGLGHVAVKIAKAMGAEVTVLSRSLAKKDDGLRLGADHYYATSDPATFEQLAGTFDLIVNTVSAELDVDAYLNLLTVNGTLAIVGATPKFSLNRSSLVRNQRAFAGSQIGGIRTTQEMLDFCAAHGVGAEVEITPAGKINEAYDRVLASDVRYRFVIDTSTLGTTS
ncbi:NAD(P)-dependent alcohol dehydrogenase [Streptomyces sp. NPDC002896]|uniref:NAD(P)-dependent alcohol dehydrogenase n=1 Tax=Streptomyces sp. NPDC002896 TaxID=3154438 RepID=UPI0033242F41